MSKNDIVVAGGIGAGSNRTQFNDSFGIYFGLVNDSLVITNRFANDIIRWIIVDTTWTLLAGDGNGLSGLSLILLNSPCSVTFDLLGNMIVAGIYNYRIQIFK
ncbi:unnamed protein product [Adineta ricciae]|uniref:Uncharacterized protein n=1 Tax=Adineta ricciae TaxID=249248 RepID=A0A815IPB3_ADIRI|nr:unnamed protein product [Adineta ricciae]